MHTRSDYRRGLVLAAALTASTLLVACNRTADAPTPTTGADTTSPASPAPGASSADPAAPSAGAAVPGSSSPGASTASRTDAARDGLADTTITAKVKTALLADSKTKGMNISVETNNGVVSLSGKVGGEDERTKAVQLARAVTGVREVADAMSTTP